MGYSIGRGRDAHAPRGCEMWGGGAVLHKVETLRQRALCRDAAAGREGLCRRGKWWGGNIGEMRRKQGEMRRKQGETKIPQCRGACGTRIVFWGFYLLSLNILTILSNASDISDKLGWLFITIMEIYSIRSSPFTSADLMVYFFCCS